MRSILPATDGVFGLQRGFKNAGIHTLLMSLKSVPDESTSSAFYKFLSLGKTKREAFAEAQKQIRKEGFTKGEEWASFILIDAYDEK